MESEDLVQEERARKAAVRKSRMESELDAENADLQEKKGVSSLSGLVHCISSVFALPTELCVCV